MKRRLVFNAAAEADLAAVVDFYDAKRAGLGRELLAAVERALSAIEDAPGAQPLFSHGAASGPKPRAGRAGTGHDEAVSGREPARPLRKYTLARFPCIIVFREQATEITALAVVHAKRRPPPLQPEVRASL